MGQEDSPAHTKIRFTLIAIEQYSTNATFTAQVSERQAGESNWLEREATRSSATRATIENQVGRQIAAAKQNRFRKQRQRAWVLAEQVALKPKRIGLAAMREG